ncbi:MAG: hypothetical protein ACTSVY_13050 [Candidatus Helarchaeota archaeon]
MARYNKYAPNDMNIKGIKINIIESSWNMICNISSNIPNAKNIIPRINSSLYKTIV